jgi:hypothetical protein
MQPESTPPLNNSPQSSAEPAIPFGYRLVQGPSQKGDGIWDGKRFRKVRKEYPHATAERPVIRKCEVVQVEMLVATQGEEEVW